MRVDDARQGTTGAFAGRPASSAVYYCMRGAKATAKSAIGVTLPRTSWAVPGTDGSLTMVATIDAAYR